MDLFTGKELQSAGARQRNRQRPLIHALHKTGAIDAPHGHAGFAIPDSRPPVDFSDQRAFNRDIGVARIDCKTCKVICGVKYRLRLDNNEVVWLSRMNGFFRLCRGLRSSQRLHVQGKTEKYDGDGMSQKSLLEKEIPSAAPT